MKKIFSSKYKQAQLGGQKVIFHTKNVIVKQKVSEDKMLPPGTIVYVVGNTAKLNGNLHTGHNWQGMAYTDKDVALRVANQIQTNANANPVTNPLR